ncbi:MAG: rhodanese-like domain-containing protein, partial [Pseudomonadota bacterium]
FVGTPRSEWLVTLDRVLDSRRLIDARESPRFRGEVEPIDRVAGHIPGAVNRFFGENLGPDGRFRDPAALRTAFTAVLDGVPPEEATFYCGSGVSACHNLLALAYAGLSPASLYVGSWSEWSSDPDRPVATGD